MSEQKFNEAVCPQICKVLAHLLRQCEPALYQALREASGSCGISVPELVSIALTTARDAPDALIDVSRSMYSGDDDEEE